MAKTKGTGGEDIGRPGPWGEGRYQQANKPVEVSVRTPPGSQPGADKRPSAPVTRRDYEQPDPAAPENGKF